MTDLRLDDINHLVEEVEAGKGHDIGSSIIEGLDAKDGAIFRYLMQDTQDRDKRLVKETFGKIFVTDEQDTCCRMILQSLTDRYHHNGEWRVMLVNVQKSSWDRISAMFRPHYARTIKIQWFDEDGDLQFNVFIEDSVYDVLAVNFSNILHQCEDSWQNWHKFITEVLKVQPWQTYKKAKGELPPSALIK